MSRRIVLRPAARDELSEARDWYEARREALEEVRQRLMRLGASDGTVTDFGSSLSVFFRDPDGLEAEVVWDKDAAALAEGKD